MATDTTLEEVLQEVLDVRLSDVHTALPGKVVRYDAAKQVADVQPMVRQAAEAPDGAVVTRAFPVLPSVPVVWPAGGGFFLSLPLAAGDTGLLVFCELPIDRWRATGQESHPADVRRHHVTSAIFFPGLLVAAQAHAEPSQAADAVFGKTGGAVVHLKPSGEVHLGAPTATAFVALATLVAVELTRINADFTALKSAIATGLTAVGAALAANGATGAAAFNGASGAVPSAAGSVAATKVKAQ